MKLLTILILGIAFLTVNFLLKKALLRIKSRNIIITTITRYFPVAELVFWTVFILYAIDVTFATSQFFIYLVFVLIVLGFVLFYLLFARDYTTGVMLKSRYHLSSGQRFKSGQLSGTVKQAHLLYIEIKSDNGTDYKVPYSQIDQKTIALDFQDSSGGESLVTVELDAKLDPQQTASKIVELAINSPWCSHKNPPNVTIAKTAKGRSIYEITCLLIGDHAASHLKELIEKELA